MKNIYLTGMMGCGKSVLAQMVAERTGLRHMDLDAAIVSDAQMTIPEIFEQKGEGFFRALESNVLYDVHHLENLVVATGGGTVLSDRNYELMHHSGIILYIKRDPDAIIASVDAGVRPLLKADPENVRRIYEERRERYESTATQIIRNDGTLEEAVDKILEATGLSG